MTASREVDIGRYIEPLLSYIVPAAVFAEPDEPRKVRSTDSEREALKRKQDRILVVDDERLIADTLALILNKSGYQAEAFYNGHSALEAAKTRCPNLVLSDVIMPNMNGVQTVLAIREICPRVRVFLLSGQARSADLLAEAHSKGFEFELLAKPIHPDHLLKKLGQRQ